MSTRTTLMRLLAVAALATLTACASGPRANPRDPLEPMNREVTKFNEGVDAVLLKPAATVYREHVPALVRTGVANFFGNLSDVWSMANRAWIGLMAKASAPRSAAARASCSKARQSP